MPTFASNVFSNWAKSAANAAGGGGGALVVPGAGTTAGCVGAAGGGAPGVPAPATAAAGADLCVVMMITPAPTTTVASAAIPAITHTFGLPGRRSRRCREPGRAPSPGPLTMAVSDDPAHERETQLHSRRTPCHVKAFA